MAARFSPLNKLGTQDVPADNIDEGGEGRGSSFSWREGVLLSDAPPSVTMVT